MFFNFASFPAMTSCSQISQMRCRCRSQPMLTEKYFAYFFHIIFDLYPYPPFFRHSSTKRDKQEKHYGRNNTCPNEHDNMLSVSFRSSMKCSFHILSYDLFCPTKVSDFPQQACNKLLRRNHNVFLHHHFHARYF